MLESLWETAAAAAAGARALVSGVAGLVGSWRTTASGAMKVTRALADAAAHPVARLPFNRTLTGRRRLGWLSLPLDQVRTLGQHRGGTVNDVALAVLADGIGRLLGSAVSDNGSVPAGARARQHPARGRARAAGQPRVDGPGRDPVRRRSAGTAVTPLPAPRP